MWNVLKVKEATVLCFLQTAWWQIFYVLAVSLAVTAVPVLQLMIYDEN